MATKPSSVPVWNTGGDNNTEPSSGKKITGWTVGEQPPSDYFNWLFKLIGEWCQYLSDGALTGAITMASTLGVTGAVTFASTLGVTGAVTLASTLAVTGAVTLSSTLSVTGLITATAGLTAGSNTHVTVSGTGRFKHGDMIRTMSGYSGMYQGTDWTNANAGGIESNSTNSASWCPQFEVGKRVKSVTFAARGNGTVDATVVISEAKTDGTTTTIGSTSDNNRSSSWGDVTVSLTNTTVSDSNAIVLTITPNASGYRVGNVRWTYDHP